jgi:hypothetical protein
MFSSSYPVGTRDLLSASNWPAPEDDHSSRLIPRFSVCDSLLLYPYYVFCIVLWAGATLSLSSDYS